MSSPSWGRGGQYVGLGTEFLSEKIPRNRLGMIFVIPRKKVLIPRHSEFRGRANSKRGMEQNGTEFREKIKFYGTRTARPLWFLWHQTLLLKIGLPSFVLSRFLFRGMVRNGIPTVCFYIFPRNGIPSCFLFLGRVRNGIPRFSVPGNSRNSIGNNHLFRLFRLPRNYFFVGNSQP